MCFFFPLLTISNDVLEGYICNYGDHFRIMGWGHSPVAEHLSAMQKAQGSILSTEVKKKMVSIPKLLVSP